MRVSHCRKATKVKGSQRRFDPPGISIASVPLSLSAGNRPLPAISSNSCQISRGRQGPVEDVLSSATAISIAMGDLIVRSSTNFAMRLEKKPGVGMSACGN
ncbi:hypothetical protein D3C71_1590160 [compost metagenome]